MARASRKSPVKKRKAKKKVRATTAAAIAQTLAAAAVTPPPPFVVDAHCHTFNASDLSKKGFITEVLLDSDEKPILKLLEPLVVLLVKLIARAPGFQEELDHLNGLHAGASLHARTAQLQADADERAAIDEEHWEDVAAELRRISRSANGRERALFEAIVDEVHPGGTRALAIAGGVETTATLAQQIALSGGAISRYIKWVGRLKHYRSDIIAELIQTYGEDSNGVRLFVSALVDFEFWLKDAPATKFPQQIELGSRLARAFPGRIHFFAPFDPWREIAAAPGGHGSLELVKKAVMEEGFIGVKVYPPMGFAAVDNSTFDFSVVGVKDSQAFGNELDAALEKLFAWAVEEDVPIMAHCNLSQQSKHGFALRASPAYWATVLAKHPGLRLNLGHFGGQGNLGANGKKGAAEWPEIIIQLMGTPEGTRLYTDVGHFDMLDASWFKLLKTALGNNEVLLSHLMYGSDWMMLATQDRYEEFLDLFRKGLSGMKSLTPEQIAALLGGNARDFLGLNAGEKSHSRLRSYYERNGIPLPAWL